MLYVTYLSAEVAHQMARMTCNEADAPVSSTVEKTYTPVEEP